MVIITIISPVSSSLLTEEYPLEKKWETSIGEKVYGIYWSPDGSLLAAATLYKLEVYTRDGQQLWGLSWDLPVCCPRWSPDSSSIVVATGWSDDSGPKGQLTLYSRDGEKLWTVLIDEWVESLAWVPGGGSILVGTGYVDSNDRYHGHLLVYTASGSKLYSTGDFGGLVSGIYWSPSGDKVAIEVFWYDGNSAREKILVYDKNINFICSLGVIRDIVYAVSWSPDESMIAVGGYDIGIKIYDTGTCEVQGELNGTYTGVVNTIVWSPSEPGILYAGTRPGSIIVLNSLGQLLSYHNPGVGWVLSIKPSPDGGMMLVTGTKGAALYSSDMRPLARPSDLGTDGLSSVGSWSPGGDLIAVTARERLMVYGNPAFGIIDIEAPKCCSVHLHLNTTSESLDLALGAGEAAQVYALGTVTISVVPLGGDPLEYSRVTVESGRTIKIKVKTEVYNSTIKKLYYIKGERLGSKSDLRLVSNETATVYISYSYTAYRVLVGTEEGWVPGLLVKARVYIQGSNNAEKIIINYDISKKLVKNINYIFSSNNIKVLDEDPVIGFIVSNPSPGGEYSHSFMIVPVSQADISENSINVSYKVIGKNIVTTSETYNTTESGTESPSRTKSPSSVETGGETQSPGYGESYAGRGGREGSGSRVYLAVIAGLAVALAGALIFFSRK